MNQKSSVSNTSAEDSNPCPICLGSINQEAYLDCCFHKFCYNCIIRWTKVVSSKWSRPLSSVKCPLCKTDNVSIIHGFDGNSFQRHYINKDFENRFLFSRAHKYRLQCYYTEPAGRLNDKFDVVRYWKSRKYLQPNRWLQSWLKREIQALFQEEDVDIILHHILGVIESFLRRNEQKSSPGMLEARREELRALVFDAARPFLTGRTGRFVNEVELFLASGLTMEAYDEVYLQCLGWNTPELTPSHDSEASNEQTPFVPYLHFSDEEFDRTD